MRACSGARTGSSSATVKRGVICCGQFQSNASIETTMRRSSQIRSVAFNRQHLRQVGPAIDVVGSHVAERLQALSMWIVHEKHGHPVIDGRVADGDVLAVARIVGPAERAIVEVSHETHRSTTMLDIRPAALGNSREIETVARLDEVLLVLGQGFRRCFSGGAFRPVRNRRPVTLAASAALGPPA